LRRRNPPGATRAACLIPQRSRIRTTRILHHSLQRSITEQVFESMQVHYDEDANVDRQKPPIMCEECIANALCSMVYSSLHARHDSFIVRFQYCESMAKLLLGVPSWLLLTIFTLTTCIVAQETFTNAACITATPAMNSCAKRWDSIRTECTKSNTLNTVWPGPCECAYFANDLPCFDDQALCVRPALPSINTQTRSHPSNPTNLWNSGV
jgi:hypothetical protein